jgi:transcriptional regulator with XRE-family HTH domain
MKHQNKFGAAFKRVRLAKGLTQEDFAQQSGRTYVSELERGIKQPTLQKIDDLVDPLAVHPLTPLVLAYVDQYDLRSCDVLLTLVRKELSEVIVSDA